MTEITDPLADYEPYFAAYFRTHPPVIVHSYWHGSTIAKFMEGVGLLRIICGSDQNPHVDCHWMEAALEGLMALSAHRPKAARGPSAGFPPPLRGMRLTSQ